MKLICIGRNYTKHIEELANEKPIDKQVLIKEVKGAKIYATFYK